MDYIKEIADALNNNHAVAMIGAGFSKNAVKTTSSDKYFKNWNELSDEFYNLIYKTIFYKGIMPSEVDFRFSSG